MGKTEDILVVKDDGKKDDHQDEIIFILHSGKNLSNKEMLGKSDPYAKIKYGSQESRTKTIKNNLNPNWEHKVTLKVDKKDPHPINIELFDDDFGKDQPLGNTSISVQDILSVGIISGQKKVLNGCKSGDIIFSANRLGYKDNVDPKVAEVVNVTKPIVKGTAEFAKIVTKEETKPEEKVQAEILKQPNEDKAKTKVLKMTEDILVIKDD